MDMNTVSYSVAAMLQKIKDPTSTVSTALSGTFVPKWKPTTAYLAGDKVLSPAGDVVSAKVNFTSGASYTAANWDLSAIVSGKIDSTAAVDKFIPRRTRTVWAIGDSNTLGSGTGGGGVTFDNTLYTAVGHSALMYQGGSWVPWALMASDCRWTVGGVFATGGYTAAQILATHVPALLAVAAPGDTVVVLAGTNGGVLADVKTLHTTLRAAGLHTVACTLPPSSAGGLSIIGGFNAGLKNFASTNGIPLTDIHSAVVDLTTGAILTAYNGDGVHFNQVGYQKIGQTVAATLNALFTTQVPLVEHNAAFTGQLQTKPLALGSPADNVDYAAMSPLGTSTIGSVANVNFKGGFGYKFMRNDTDINARMMNYTFTPGHKMRVGFALEANMTGTGGWGFRFESGTTGQKIPWALGYPASFTISQPACRFFADFIVPTIPDFSYRMRIGVFGVPGNYLHIGEVTIQNLTLMGL